MIPRRFPTRLATLLLPLVALPTLPLFGPAAAAEEFPTEAIQPPAKALKYHRVLLRRPAPGYLFDRFFNAWLDEAPVAALQAFLARRAKDPGTPADGLLLALLHAKRGDDVAAIEQFRKTLAADPGNAAAWRQKAELEARTLDFETALADLDAADKAQPSAELALEIAKLRGQLLVRSGKREEALAAMAKLLADNADDQELAEDVIELQVREGLFDAAIETLGSLIENTRDPYRRVLRQLRRGDVHQQAGRRAKAVEVYSETLDAAGDGSWLEREILAQIERAYRREEDTRGLKERYAKLLEDFPGRVGVRRGYARVLADGGDFDEAIEQFEQVLRLTPGDRANREAFVQLYVLAGNLDGARTQLQALIAQHPDDAELHVQAAQLAGRAKDNQAAAAAVEAYLQRSDRGEYDYLRAARLLQQVDLTDEAATQYAALTEAFPESAGAKEARAAFLYKTNNKEEAVSLWRAAAAGDDPTQAVRVAKALAARGEHEAAYQLLLSRADQFASNGLLLGELVSEALALKKHTEAAPWALRRVDLAESPGELDAAIIQATTLHERGETLAEAIASLQDAAATPQRACLLAELLERSGDLEQADTTLTPWVERGDLLATGQRVRMARGRQDWPAAIAATKAMIESPGGRKSRNVRRLVEFYERNLQVDEALQWTEQWKRLSPGSTSPWLTQARLLELEGKQREATQALREGLKRFDGATELRSRLAMLYRATGQLDDAESLYWREYEEGADLLSKLRAVEQLARVAEQAGKTEALVAAFEQRRKASRESIEPLMALATVHRVARDFDKRLQALAEAAKLRPNDLPLLLQIARVQEQEGEWERARDTLRRAMDLDKTDRTRRQLAALLLRWGSPEEGYALLMQQKDGVDASPKDVEQLAGAMISAGDWDRAAELLEPYVAKHAEEPRLRFLLAASLEEIGELTRAADHFTQVLNAPAPPDTAPDTAPATASARGGYFDQIARIAPPGVRDLLAVNQLRYTVYQYRQQRQGVYAAGVITSGGGTLTRLLPATHEQTRQYAALHLLAIGEMLDDSVTQTLRERITRSGLPQADVLVELGASTRRENPPLERLLERFPDRPEVMAYAILGLGGQNTRIPADFFRAAFDRFKASHPQLALLAGLQGMMPHGELADLEPEVVELLESIDSPSGASVSMLCSLPQRVGRGASWTDSGLPKSLEAKVRDRLLTWYPKLRDSSPQGPYLFRMMLTLTTSSDDPADYVSLLDAEANRGKSRNSPQASRTLYSGSQRQSTLQGPAFPPKWLPGFSAAVLGVVSPTGQLQPRIIHGVRQSAAWKWSNEQLAAALPAVTNPVLKLLLADKVGDEELAEQTLQAMLAAEKPTLDTCLLAAGWAAKQKDLAAAVEHLTKARYLPMNRASRRLVDTQALSLVLQQIDASAAGDEPDEELLEIGRKAALRLRRGVLQDLQRQQLATAMIRLGLDDEAEKLHRVASAPSRSRRAVWAPTLAPSPGTPKVDRVRRLIDSGKRDAAARLLATEAMATVRQLAAQRQNRSYVTHQAEQLTRRLTRYGLTNEIISSMNPGESRSHRRFGEYADLLRTIGRTEEAAAAYERALELRPREDAYRVSLIELAVESDDKDAAAERLTKLGRDGPRLVAQAVMGSLNNHRATIARRLAWAELGIALLRQSRDEKNADLSWAPQLRRGLGARIHSRAGRRGSLYQLDKKSDAKPNEEALRRRRLHDDLCREMLTIPQLAADGFMGLHASHEAAGELDAVDFDQMAINALLSAKPSPAGGNYSRTRYLSNNQPRLAPQRLPGEYVVLKCFGERDWRLLDETLLPKLREGKNEALAASVERYAKLYRVPADGFADAAQAYSRRDDTSRPQAGAPTALKRVIEAYRLRDLGVDLQPVVAEMVRHSLQDGGNPQGASPMVVDYTLDLAKTASDAEMAAWLERIAEVYAGPREGRAAFIAGNYRPRRVQFGTPSSGLHGLAACLPWLLAKPETVLPTVRFLRQGNVTELIESGDTHVRTGLQAALTVDNPGAAAEFLERSGVLGELDADSIAWAAVGDAGEPFGKLLADRLKRFNSKAALLETDALKPSPDQAGGALLVRVWLGDEAAIEPLLACFGGELDETEQWPATVRAAAAEILAAAAAGREVGSLGSDIAATLNWAKRQRSAKATSKVEKVLKARTLEELKLDAHRVDNWLSKTMTELADSDPDAAAKIFFKTVDLYEDARRRGVARIYFGRPAAIHYLQQVAYRFDREAVGSTKLMLNLLQVGGERLTVSGSSLQNQFLNPVVNRAELFVRLSKKGGGGDDAFLPPLVTWLQESFGPAGSPVLAPAYEQFFKRQQRKVRDASEVWLQTNLESASEDPQRAALLADLRAACRHAAASQGGNPASESRRAAHEHWRRVLGDSAHPLSVRATLADWVCRTSHDYRPLETDVSIASVFTDACKTTLPLASGFESSAAACTQRLLDQPSGEAAHAAGEAYRKAWIKRFTKHAVGQQSHMSHGSPHASNDSTSMLIMLAACYQQQDKASARLILNKYRRNLGAYHESIGLMVREGELTDAAFLFGACWETVRVSRYRGAGVRYDQRVADNTPELLKLVGSRPRQYLAKCLLANLSDPPEAERGDLPTKSERLTELAKGFDQAGLVGDRTRNKALLLLDHEAVIGLVASQLKQQAEKIDLVKLSEANDDSFDRSASLVALHGRTAATRGDLKPALRLLDQAFTDVSDQNWRLQNARQTQGRKVAELLQQHAHRASPEELADAAQRLRKHLGVHRDGWSWSYPRQHLLSACLVLHAEGGLAEEFGEWTRGLDDKMKKSLVDRGLETELARLAGNGLDRGEPETFERRIRNLTRLSQAAEAAGWLVTNDALRPTVKQYGNFTDFRPFGSLFLEEELTKAVTAVGEAEDLRQPTLWLAGAWALASANRHAEAADAWAEVIARLSDSPKLLGAAKLERAAALAKAGDKPAAVKALQELAGAEGDTLSKNLPTRGLRTRYAKQAAELGMTPAPKTEDEKADKGEPAGAETEPAKEPPAKSSPPPPPAPATALPTPPAPPTPATTP